MDRPKYAAISHVWEPTKEGSDIAKALDKNLFTIETKKGARPKVSWYGLQQAATAAKYLRCDYLWLDLLCIEQHGSGDKAKQIRNMSTIYKDAEAVLVMFGGCRAVQGIEHHSPWIERAWTLQESTVNPNTWALIALNGLPTWRTQKVLKVASVNTTITISTLGNETGLVKLRELLNVGINQSFGTVFHPARPNNPYNCSAQMKCLGSNQRSIETMKIIIDHIQSDSIEDKTIVKSAAWSSIWMRTSTEPLDMVFSIMHLLGVELQVKYDLSAEELYLELACQTSRTPIWLTIAPYAKVIRGLVPTPSKFTPNSLDPDLASQLVDINDMITWTDIEVVNSEPLYFELCGLMFDVLPDEKPSRPENPRDLLLSHGDIVIHCTQCTVFQNVGEIAMIVGQQWRMSDSFDSL
jgi:Heterokaryon incompatibility protein (HET)